MIPEMWQDVVAWSNKQKLRACCFDFGGTLLDFEPIHVQTFLQALRLAGVLDSHAVDEARNIVHRELMNGRGSVDIATTLVASLGLNIDPLELAVQKRTHVEESIANATLITPIATLLTELAANVQLAVITRGMASSAKDIMLRSLLPSVATGICVLGRDDLTSQPPKLGLLRLALNRVGCRSEEMGYVGDTDDDAEIAALIQCHFLKFQPFAI